MRQRGGERAGRKRGYFEIYRLLNESSEAFYKIFIDSILPR